MLVIGNIIIGERYAEPQGPFIMTNTTTGDICEADIKPRGTWNTKEEDKQYISAVIKNKDGQVKYTLSGRYTKEINATEVETGKTFTVWSAPKFPEGPQPIKKIYGMNLYAL